MPSFIACISLKLLLSPKKNLFDYHSIEQHVVTNMFWKVVVEFVKRWYFVIQGHVCGMGYIYCAHVNIKRNLLILCPPYHLSK
jgi:hypothetical protein